MPNFKQNKERMNWFVDGTVLGLLGLCILICFLFLLFCLYDPRAVIFAGQLIPLKYYHYFPMGVIIAFVHTFNLFVFEIAVVIVANGVIIYLFYVFILVQEIRLKSRKAYRTRDSLRQAENLRYFYRSLQIINANAMCFMGQYVAIFHALFTVYPIFINSVFVCFGDKLDWIVVALLIIGDVWSVGFWLFVLQIGKCLWVTGNKNFDSWAKVGFIGNRLEKNVMKKFRKSCKLILIHHGKFLVLGRMTQFVYVKSLIIYTCKVLLALKKI